MSDPGGCCGCEDCQRPDGRPEQIPYVELLKLRTRAAYPDLPNCGCGSEHCVDCNPALYRAHQERAAGG